MNNNKINIQNFLPHREPMLMVDELITITNESAVTKFTINKNSIFVSGSRLSESGIIENAAQTCSCIVGKGFFDKDDTEGDSNNLIGFISAIKTAEIHRLPSVDELVTSKAELVNKFDAQDYIICTMNCKVNGNNNMLLAEFIMNLFIREA